MKILGVATLAHNIIADGSFNLNISPDDNTLVINHPEYETAEVNITGKTTLQIVLKLANSGAINLPGSLWPLSLNHSNTDLNCR